MRIGLSVTCTTRPPIRTLAVPARIRVVRRRARARSQNECMHPPEDAFGNSASSEGHQRKGGCTRARSLYSLSSNATHVLDSAVEVAREQREDVCCEALDARVDLPPVVVDVRVRRGRRDTQKLELLPREEARLILHCLQPRQVRDVGPPERAPAAQFLMQQPEHHDGFAVAELRRRAADLGELVEDAALHRRPHVEDQPPRDAEEARPAADAAASEDASPVRPVAEVQVRRVTPVGGHPAHEVFETADGVAVASVAREVGDAAPPPTGHKATTRSIENSSTTRTCFPPLVRWLGSGTRFIWCNLCGSARNQQACPGCHPRSGCEQIARLLRGPESAAPRRCRLQSRSHIAHRRIGDSAHRS